MDFHRQQSQFDRARWRSFVLAPSWMLQVTASMALVGISSASLSETTSGEHNTGESARDIAGIILPLIPLSLCAFDWMKLFQEILTPSTMLVTHSVKLLAAVACLAVYSTSYALEQNIDYSIAGITFSSSLFLIVLATTAYAVKAYRRIAAFDDYHYPSNAKGFGYHDIEATQSDESRRFSAVTLTANSIRRISMSSVKGSFSITTQPRTEEEAAPSLPASTYSHERDTAFDNYVLGRRPPGECPVTDQRMRSSSGSASYVTSNRSVSNGSEESAVTASTLGPVVGRGSVSSGKVNQDSINRVASYDSSHALVTVPEGDEEQGTSFGSQRSTGRTNDGDGEALLGHRRDTGSNDDSDGEIANVAAIDRHRDETRRALGDFDELDLGERK